MQGRWLGDWQGKWLGDGVQTAHGEMFSVIVGRGTLSGALDALIEGTSGGANWTRAYKPKHDHLKRRRKKRENDDSILLFLF